MIITPRPASAIRVDGKENEPFDAPDSVTLPLPLHASLFTQLSAFGLVAAFAATSGRPVVAIAAVAAMIAVLVVYRMLATRPRGAWRAACRCTASGLVALTVLTPVAAFVSPVHGALGVIACLLQFQYLAALRSPRAHEFFNAGGEETEHRPHLKKLPIRCHASKAKTRRLTLRRNVIRSIGVLVVLSLGFSVGRAGEPTASTLEDLLAKVPDSYAPQRDNVIKRLNRYRDFSQSNKVAAENELNVRLRNATQTSGPESHEAIAIQATLKWLSGEGAPPKNTASMTWIVSYAENIAREQSFVWKHLAILLKKLTRAGLNDEVEILHSAFRHLESSYGPSESVLHGRKFKGYRATTDGKKLISLSVNVAAGEGSDDEFIGRIERDFMYRGHPVHHITGQFVGVHVMIQTGSVQAFGSKSDHAWTYHGCVIGKSIIGRYAGRDKKGKPKGGMFHLRVGR